MNISVKIFLSQEEMLKNFLPEYSKKPKEQRF